MPTFLGDTYLTRLKIALEAIGDGSTTWNTSSTKRPKVYREKEIPAAMPASRTIAIGPHVETLSRVTSSGTSSIYTVDSNTTVVYLLEAQAPDEAASGATHDLIKAVRDHTLSSSVDTLSIGQIETGVSDVEGVRVMVRMTLTATYRFDEDTPDTRI